MIFMYIFFGCVMLVLVTGIVWELNTRHISTKPPIKGLAGRRGECLDR